MKFKIQPLIIASLLLLISCSKNATLTITDVEVNNPKKFSDLSAKLLGQRVDITFYDKSAMLIIGGQEKYILKQTGENEYFEDGTSMVVSKSFGRIANVKITHTDTGNYKRKFNEEGYGAALLATTIVTVIAKP